MTSRANKRVVATFIATVFNEHALEALPQFVDNDRLAAAATGLVRGHPNVHLTVDHSIAEGDLVAVRISGSGTHTGAGWRGLEPTGKPWQATCNAHYRVTNGKIVDFWVNWDYLSIMQQIGVLSLK
jgi:predicted ester cyclase